MLLDATPRRHARPPAHPPVRVLASLSLALLLHAGPARATALGLELPPGLPPGPTPQLLSLLVEEQLSAPFRVELELAYQGAIPADAVLGQAVAAWTEEPGLPRRWFHGRVSRLSDLGTDESGRSSHRLVLVPRLWFLGLTADCRVFQDQSALEVVQQVLAEGGVDHVEPRLTDSYPIRECVVQYNESDLAFVSRLLEEEGIFYFFEHASDRHVLVLADSVESLVPRAGFATIPFVGEGPGAPDGIQTWEQSSQVRTVSFVHDDYKFEQPSTDLKAMATHPLGTPLGDLEVYEYPGNYSELSEGQRLAQARLQALQADLVQGSGRASSSGLAAGARITLTDHPRFNGAYHVQRAVHRVESGSGYRTEFVVVPTSVPFRAPRTTPKPKIAGVQTAIVVGPEGEQVHADEFGRVKVQFHWDRLGRSDENSSCWIRVQQDWGGRSRNSVEVPRIGEEVIVSFLEGDPDRPMILGKVYNAETMPPHGLPGGRIDR